MKITCFPGNVPNSEKRQALLDALRTIIDLGAVPFMNRGGYIQLDWYALQKLVNEDAEKRLDK